MKPYQIFLFLISIFFCLFLLVLIFPRKGIPIGNTFRLRFSQFDDYLRKDTIKYADIKGILENSEVIQENEEPNESAEGNLQYLNDSLRLQSDSIQSPICRIEVSPENMSILFPIFKELHTLSKTKQLVRILHYGDSQIENDRFTSFFRNKMQTLFGGTGIGLLSPVPLDHGLLAIKQEFSQNWVRYTGFINQDSTLGHKRYGAMLSFAKQKSLPADTSAEEISWLSFSPSSMGYAKSRKFNKASLYLTNRTDTVTLKVIINDSLVDSRKLIPKPFLEKINIRFKKTPGKITFLFEGMGITELYGISLDNSWGVAVDNIPLRGSSGLVFSKTDTKFLVEMYKKLNVRMLILQFGGNIVPLNADDYSFYEKYFRRELNIIKEMLPEVPVIVIGPSDMSIKEADKFVTYPNLTKVRDAIKNATLGSGYAFWDMFEAMGGENSMPSWVDADPPLAVPDFVHFTVRGAKVMAEMFYNAFIYEYYRWLDTENNITRK